MIGERDTHPECLRPTFPRPFSLDIVSLCHPLSSVLPTVVLRLRLQVPPGGLGIGDGNQLGVDHVLDVIPIPGEGGKGSWALGRGSVTPHSL